MVQESAPSPAEPAGGIDWWGVEVDARRGEEDSKLGGYESGYGYCLPPYGTAYRRALRTTRTRSRTRPEALGGGLSRLTRVAKVTRLSVDVDQSLGCRPHRLERPRPALRHHPPTQGSSWGYFKSQF